MYILMLSADLSKFFQILSYTSMVEQISDRDKILQIYLFLKKGIYLTTQCKYLWNAKLSHLPSMKMKNTQHLREWASNWYSWSPISAYISMQFFG